jgi:hypothetical protein
MHRSMEASTCSSLTRDARHGSAYEPVGAAPRGEAGGLVPGWKQNRVPELREPGCLPHQRRRHRPDKLTNGAGRNGAPAWSPDGRHMAFVRVQSERPRAVHS